MYLLRPQELAWAVSYERWSDDRKMNTCISGMWDTRPADLAKRLPLRIANQSRVNGCLYHLVMKILLCAFDCGSKKSLQ
jgi:hypothetical protein